LVNDVRIIENLGNSDHSMVAFFVQHKLVCLINKRPIRVYDKGDYQSIRDELKQINWDVYV